jgi:hypothetical protein
VGLVLVQEGELQLVEALQQGEEQHQEQPLQQWPGQHWLQLLLFLLQQLLLFLLLLLLQLWQH